MKTPKLLRSFRKSFEALFLCLGFAIIPLLPRRCIVSLSRGLGSLAFACSRKQRRIAFANLDLAFGDGMPQSRKTEILRESFQTSALMILDILWFSVSTVKRIKKYVSFDPLFDDYLSRSPLVVITGHFGNWEIAGMMIALRGWSLLSVAAPLKNSVANVLINRTRRKTGQKVAQQKGAIKAVMRELKNGGRTALLMDQNTLPRKGGEFVTFFGLPVPISKAAATLCARTGSSLVFGYCIADENGQYVTHGLPPVKIAPGGLREEDITQTIAGWLEQTITEHPGKWLWMYRRWRYVPEGADISKYPFYAEHLPSAS
ncbi:MAG: lysophospholipid acyltransferase family protein [Kiritimatiellia bacterium]|jgi:KDO2-lipid IV(A) lauroyltransferase|nr:lysophospholipid acyltransferase family protein [Kiritimatiellia bacterium]